jgi:hypothetical protein
MSIGLILSIIGFLIKYGPAIWSLATEVIEMIRKLRDPQEREAFTAEWRAACEHYRVNKDRRPLERLRERLRKRCFGDECPVP